MTKAAAAIVNGAMRLLFAAAIEFASLAAFILLLLIWVEIGLPFSLVHATLLGLVAVLAVSAIARRIGRKPANG